MEISTLSRKATHAVKTGVGICLTPIAVLGVTSVAFAVFVLDRLDRRERRTASGQLGLKAEAN
ncbi:MAG: hypothetical protein QHC67_02680 [Sphingobium sp.]|uniref:hypothetical protein n=1 Tax=Sphingobium sp. TaxID=1912891 RepID=UPI0029B26071|nr:hypothetical protein [Sphingobium sp.]MDX3908704.1 hypothetical protein [Sphingobium sp.]